MQDQTLRELEQLIPTLRRYARFLLYDAHAADDLVQDCLERAVRYLHQFQEGTNLRAWLLSIMRNCFLDGKRREKRQNEVALDAVPGEAMCSPAHQEHALLLRELAKAFLSLPDDQKLAMICVIFEGQRYEEAAATLGVAVGTVKSRVARGREALRRATAGEPLGRSGGTGFPLTQKAVPIEVRLLEEEDLWAFAAGDVDAETKEAIEAYLLHHPEAAGRVEAYRRAAEQPRPDTLTLN